MESDHKQFQMEVGCALQDGDGSGEDASHCHPICSADGVKRKDDIIYVDDGGIVCADMYEYQQVQSAGSLWLNADSGSSESNEAVSAASDEGVGNLREVCDSDVKELRGESDHAHGEDENNLDSATQFAEEALDMENGGAAGDGDDVESLAHTPARHPRDPMFGLLADEFSDTGYMCESEVLKSHVGVKHPRSESIMLHCDAQKLLRVSRGHRNLMFGVHTHKCVDVIKSLQEEAGFVYDKVFRELRQRFSDVLQFQRLLRLSWVNEWNGRSHI